MGNPTQCAGEAAPSSHRSCADVATPSGAAEGRAALRGESEALPWPASLEPSCLRALERLSSGGVALSEDAQSPVFALSFGGEVPHDGSCLFAAVVQAAGLECTVAELRHRVVKRVLADAGAGLLPRDVDSSLPYSPDLTKGWGVHWVQERRLVVLANDLPAAAQAIDELQATGMERARAAELVYNERGSPVDDVQSWARLMACDGLGGGEYRAVVLRYCEDGLLDVDDDLAGSSATFGDELALLGLACELRRPIHVVQAHGEDAGLGSDDQSLFFLPHHPLSYAASDLPPIFLLMRGASWTANGGDHFEPLIATSRSSAAAGPPAYTL